MTLSKIRTTHPSIHSTTERLHWAQHWLNVDAFQPQEGTWAHEALERKYVGKKGKFREPPPHPNELIACGRARASVPIQTPETGPSTCCWRQVAQHTHGMLRDFLWPEFQMAQAEVAHLVCQSGEQFLNEAEEERPAGKDPPPSPRSRGAPRECSTWWRRRGGGPMPGHNVQSGGALVKIWGTGPGEARA